MAEEIKQYTVPKEYWRECGSDEHFSKTVANPSAIVSRDDVKEAAERLVNSRYAPEDDDGFRFTADQVQSALWFYLQTEIEKLVQDIDEYAIDGRNTDAFFRALSTIGLTDQERIDERVEENKLS